MSDRDSPSVGPATISILFVCLGNICRSPLAEGVAQHLVEERGLADLISVDSAGTGAWHAGEPPDQRSIEVAMRHGIPLEGRARQLRGDDLFDFDHVIGMDGSNLSKLKSLKERNGGTAHIGLLRDWDPDPGDGEVPDPYYGGPGGFEHVFELVVRSVNGLLDEIEGQAGANG